MDTDVRKSRPSYLHRPRTGRPERKSVYSRAEHVITATIPPSSFHSARLAAEVGPCFDYVLDGTVRRSRNQYDSLLSRHPDPRRGSGCASCYFVDEIWHTRTGKTSKPGGKVTTMEAGVSKKSFFWHECTPHLLTSIRPNYSSLWPSLRTHPSHFRR
jgi:hypothetical protein